MYISLTHLAAAKTGDIHSKTENSENLTIEAEKVMSLDIKPTGKRNLVTTDLDTISHLEPLSVGNGLYVITKTPNPEKVKQINAIIEKLSIKARVKYIQY